MKPIAFIHNDFPTKFGIPRQSGLIDELKSEIIFTSEFRNAEALRGLDEFSHIWLIWEFSQNNAKKWSPTVRPPRLGGNKRIGVFATRSPFRPNSLGLSCVKLDSIEYGTKNGAVLHISGADLMNGTPIFDIKPYLKISDCHTDAVDGFAEQTKAYALSVIIPEALSDKINPQHKAALIKILESDPRPSYQNDPDRVYGFAFASMEIRFKVANGVVTVCDII